MTLRLRRLVAVYGMLLAMSAVAMAAERTAARGLSTVIPAVDLKGVALDDAMDYLRDVGGINLTVNWKAIEATGVTRTTPVDLQVRRVTVEQALRMLLRQASGGNELGYTVSENVVEVTTLELADAQMVTRVYPVADLLLDVPNFTNAPTFDLSSASSQGGSSGSGGGGSGGGGGGGGLFSDTGNSGGGGSGGTTGTQVGTSREQRITQLIDLITSTVRPEIWRVNGGSAGIAIFRDNLIITAPPSVHAAIGGHSLPASSVSSRRVR